MPQETFDRFATAWVEPGLTARLRALWRRVPRPGSLPVELREAGFDFLGPLKIVCHRNSAGNSAKPAGEIYGRNLRGFIENIREAERLESGDKSGRDKSVKKGNKKGSKKPLSLPSSAFASPGFIVLDGYLLPSFLHHAFALASSKSSDSLEPKFSIPFFSEMKSPGSFAFNDCFQ